MKPYLPLFLIVLLFLPSLACGTVNVTSPEVSGSRNIITQTVDVSNFDRVSLESSGDVYIEQGDRESLTIEADDNILPLLDAKVRGRELALSTKPNTNINPSQPIVYRLTVKDLNRISLMGSGNFFVEPVASDRLNISVLGSGDVIIKGLKVTDLSLDLSGSGNITVEDLDAKTVDTRINGSGDISLAGQSATEQVSVNGSGNYMAGDLESASADVRIPGSADVTVWVTQQLTVDINGSGDVRYYGKPSIDQSGLGSGHLSSLGDK